MTAKPGNPRVDAYVDGLLDGQARQQFEADAAADAGLADELAAQRWIDDELRDMYAYQARPLSLPDEEAAPAPIPIRQGRMALWKAAAIAATLLIALAGVWWVVGQRGGMARPRPVALVPPDQVYTRLATDWKPEFECTTQQEFADVVKKRLGSPLVLATVPDLKAIGWTYPARFRGKIVGDKTMILLTNVGEAKVLVLMDQAASDRTLTVDPASKLSVFRRQVGDIVLYEVTPLSEPRVLEHFYNPDKGGPGSG